MATKSIISTDKAPAAIGTYSQAVRTGDLLFVSGQIPLEPDSMEVVSMDVREQIDQVFKNLAAVIEAAGAGLNDAVRLTVYLQDLANFPIVNELMAEHMQAPYPARAAIGVSALPRDVAVEIDAIVALS